jgi:divalent metal cation (Fe/Co/Zn/Cd) transporter
MTTSDPDAQPSTEAGHAVVLARARAVSVVSLGWTLTVSTVALLVGLAAQSLVLIAFALMGAFDALGSAALVIHFGRALRFGTVSERFERAVLRLVVVGMWGVAFGTGVQSVMRLASDDAADATLAGTVLAAASSVVLVLLARRKASIGRSVPSAALIADSHLTKFGAVLALITLLGTASTDVLGWRWLDPCAALLVAALLLVVGATVARDAARLPVSEH